MKRIKQQSSSIIFISFLAALVLLTIPLPNILSLLRPQFALLVLIYWTLYTPERVGITTAFVLGLLLDALQGGILGQYALAFTIVAYVVYRLQARLRMFPIFQQMFSVFVFMALVQVISMWSHYLMDQPVAYLLQWLSVLTTALFWPLVSKSLNFLRDV